LSDEALTGEAKIVENLEGRAMIGRADVAAWMLDAIEARTFTRRTATITVSGAA
jgi:hypothetical protein